MSGAQQTFVAVFAILCGTIVALLWIANRYGPHK